MGSASLALGYSNWLKRSVGLLSDLLHVKLIYQLYLPWMVTFHLAAHAVVCSQLYRYQRPVAIYDQNVVFSCMVVHWRITTENYRRLKFSKAKIFGFILLLTKFCHY